MERTEEIRKLAESALAESQFIVDILTSFKGQNKVLVIVDGDQGLHIDDCAEISRKLSKALDESGFMDENYMLEVSTPGVEHPLKLKRQYVKNIGRKLKIKLADKTVEGRLSEVHEGSIIVTQEVGMGKKKETQTLEIPFAEIEKTFVLISFK
jgi:ribosome maturation factor RimP